METDRQTDRRRWKELHGWSDGKKNGQTGRETVKLLKTKEKGFQEFFGFFLGSGSSARRNGHGWMDGWMGGCKVSKSMSKSVSGIFVRELCVFSRSKERKG